MRNIALIYTEFNEKLGLDSICMISFPKHIDFKVS